MYVTLQHEVTSPLIKPGTSHFHFLIILFVHGISIPVPYTENKTLCKQWPPHCAAACWNSLPCLTLFRSYYPTIFFLSASLLSQLLLTAILIPVTGFLISIHEENVSTLINVCVVHCAEIHLSYCFRGKQRQIPSAGSLTNCPQRLMLGPAEP